MEEIIHFIMDSHEEILLVKWNQEAVPSFASERMCVVVQNYPRLN